MGEKQPTLQLLTIADVARVLACSQVAAKITLFRARKKLLPILKRFEPNGRGMDADGPRNPTSCQSTAE